MRSSHLSPAGHSATPIPATGPSTTPTIERPRARRTHAPAGLLTGLLAMVLLALTLPAPVAHAQPAGQVHQLTTADADAWLDGMVPSLLGQGNVSGATVSIVKDGQLLTARGYGSATRWSERADGSEPVDPARHLFRIGSVAKLTTAVAAMQLVEAGKLDLDGDVADQVDVSLDLPKGPITPRHLMTHSAGFEDYLGESFMVSDPAKFPGLREVLADQPDQIAAPGTVSAYSNYGVALLGRIVELKSGQSFDEYVQRNIFTPLGMNRSTTAQPLPPEFAGDMVAGFDDPNSDPEPQPFELIGPAPAGSQSSTSVDMATFANFILGHGPRILSPESLAQMTRPAIDPARAPQHAGASNTLGLQFWLSEINGTPAPGHGGDTGLFHSQLMVFPEHDMGIFISQNGMGTQQTDLRPQVIEQFANRYVAPPVATPQSIEGSAEAAKELAGSYTMSRQQRSGPIKLMNPLGQVTVVGHDDGTVQLKGQPSRYRQIAPGRWQLAAGPAYLGNTEFSTDGRTIVLAPGHELVRSRPLEQLPIFVGLLIVSVLIGLVGSITVAAGLLRGRRARHTDAEPPSGILTRLSRLAMVGTGVGMVGTIAAVGAFAALAMDMQPADGAYRVAQVFGLVTAVAGLGAAIRAGSALGARARGPAVGATLMFLAALVFCGLCLYYNLGLVRLRY